MQPGLMMKNIHINIAPDSMAFNYVVFNRNRFTNSPNDHNAIGCGINNLTASVYT